MEIEIKTFGMDENNARYFVGVGIGDFLIEQNMIAVSVKYAEESNKDNFVFCFKEAVTDNEIDILEIIKLEKQERILSTQRNKLNRKIATLKKANHK